MRGRHYQARKPEALLDVLTRLPVVARLGARYVATSLRARQNRHLFDGVEKYCMFIGYPRSGHTLIGALLDAHPETVIGHERAAMQHVHAGFDRDRLYQMLLDSATRGGAKRWVSGEYRYHVPRQWQGRFERLTVIGDKQAEGATLRIREKPALLGRLTRIVSNPRFVHVVRNPFDNITTMATRAARTGPPDLDVATGRYFRLCETARWIGEQVSTSQLRTIRHEDLVHDPGKSLGNLCAWLGLEPSEKYLDDCASIVQASPNPSRYKVPWDTGRKRAVQKRIADFEHLNGYSFDETGDSA